MAGSVEGGAVGGSVEGANIGSNEIVGSLDGSAVMGLFVSAVGDIDGSDEGVNTTLLPLPVATM